MDAIIEQGPVTIGKRQVSPQEIIPLIAAGDLWQKVMWEQTIDNVLKHEQCTAEELAAFYHQEIGKEPAYLERRAWQLRGQGVPEQMVDYYLARPYLIERFKNRMFSQHVANMFLKLKHTRDRVVFSLIRQKDKALLEELYYRIETGECSFAEAAQNYSEGSESVTGGLIGPAALGQLHTYLQQVLLKMTPGNLSHVVQVQDWYALVQLHRIIPAELDDAMRQELIDLQFREWVDAEIKTYFFGTVA